LLDIVVRDILSFHSFLSPSEFTGSYFIYPV
jgi:hypothetical protein